MNRISGITFEHEQDGCHKGRHDHSSQAQKPLNSISFAQMLALIFVQTLLTTVIIVTLLVGSK